MEAILKKGSEPMSNGDNAPEKSLSTFIKLENQYELLNFKNCNELVVFATINSFCKSHGYYSGGYTYLSKHLPISHKTAIRTIKSLVDKNYIVEIPGRYNTTNKYKPNAEYINEILGYSQNGYTQIDYSQNDQEYGQNDQSSMVKMTTSKNIVRIDSKNKEVEEEKQSSTTAVFHDEKENNKEIVSENSEALSKVLEMYRENICMAHNQYQLRPLEITALKNLVKEHSADMVNKAIERTVKRGKYNLGYIEAILTCWKKNGYDDGKAPAPPKQKQAEQPKKETVYVNQEMSIGWEGRE